VFRQLSEKRHFLPVRSSRGKGARPAALPQRHVGRRPKRRSKRHNIRVADSTACDNVPRDGTNHVAPQLAGPDSAAYAVGGHVLACSNEGPDDLAARDWNVVGAAEPLKRPETKPHTKRPVSMYLHVRMRGRTTLRHATGMWSGRLSH
jgi:hypothetical protein